MLQESYFQMIKDTGFDHVRIPVRWSTHALYEAYTIIRADNPTRKIVIGTPDWGGLYGLFSLEIPTGDPNIIVTFHYYEPL